MRMRTAVAGGVIVAAAVLPSTGFSAGRSAARLKRPSVNEHA